MKSSIFLLAVLLTCCQTIECQTPLRVINVDFYLENDKIVVKYVIAGSLPKETMAVSLKFISEDNKEIIPRTTIGDIGENISSDGLKIIIWDILADQMEISGVLKAIVTITDSHIPYRGPSNALLSVFFPSLGGYFVDEIKIRSLFTTLSIGGLLAYGINQKIQSDKYYADYNVCTNYSQISTLYEKANEAQHCYFKAACAAATVWIADIIWVACKGAQNKKKALSFRNQNISNRFNIQYTNNELLVGYQITF